MPLLLDASFVGLTDTLYSKQGFVQVYFACVQSKGHLALLAQGASLVGPSNYAPSVVMVLPGCVFVGVQTGMSNSSVVEPRYNYTLRRAMLRATWFPRTHQDRHRCGSVPPVTTIAACCACRQ